MKTLAEIVDAFFYVDFLLIVDLSVVLDLVVVEEFISRRASMIHSSSGGLVLGFSW